ncbi:MAG TPA: hypothetical protein VKD88_05495, partial [Gaiellaceae bacterium]|nr:hypothetical protein [Gaiellaceae bacterium]
MAGHYGRGMAYISTQGREGEMYKRTFKTLLAASVIGVAIPVQAAMGMPTDHSGGAVVVQKSTPLVWEKAPGLNGPVQQAAPTVSGTLDPWQQNLNARAKYAQVSDPWALNLFARQSNSDSGQTTVGLHRNVSVVATGGFDWADAGIGAASVFGIMLLGAASVVT